jgi:hypothetical protein
MAAQCALLAIAPSNTTIGLAAAAVESHGLLKGS